MRLGSILFLLVLSYFFNPIQPVVDQPIEEISFQSDIPYQLNEEHLDASVIDPEEVGQLS